MRTLYLVRHAKSSWADAVMRDHDRPLNARGSRDAPMMAKLFKERNEQVDLIISSTALRARTTANFFTSALNLSSDRSLLNANIYEASLSSLMQIVQALPDTSANIMLFGHNPGFSELAYYLCDEDPIELATCAMVKIELYVDHWELASKGIGNRIWSDSPKQHL